MTRERDAIDKALQQKGFQKETGDHFHYIYWNLSGKKTMKRTKMSHGSSHKTIDDSLLGQMARQVGLTKKSFLELIDCTLDRAGYEGTVFPNN